MELNCFSSGVVNLVIKNEERCWCNIFFAIEVAFKIAQCNWWPGDLTCLGGQWKEPKLKTIFYFEKALLLVAPVVELYLYKVLEANLRNLHNNACF